MYSADSICLALPDQGQGLSLQDRRTPGIVFIIDAGYFYEMECCDRRATSFEE